MKVIVDLCVVPIGVGLLVSKYSKEIIVEVMNKSVRKTSLAGNVSAEVRV